MLRDPQGKQKGTPLSMAPEVLLNREFNEKADVYSFGLVLWEFVSRTDPFPQHEVWLPSFLSFLLLLLSEPALFPPLSRL
jgi:serine/threonine protein kinase